MSDVFTASNGTKIETSEIHGGLDVTSNKDVDYLFKKHVDALREWFQAERDEELGMWRDPESPDWVVYLIDVHGDVRKIGVRNERDRRTFIIRENGSITGASFREVAGRWFAAHPMHRAWHDARPGEAWAITVKGVEFPVIVRSNVPRGGAFFEAYGRGQFEPRFSGITAGRRVWAPDDGDDDE